MQHFLFHRCAIVIPSPKLQVAIEGNIYYCYLSQTLNPSWADRELSSGSAENLLM